MLHVFKSKTYKVQVKTNGMWATDGSQIFNSLRQACIYAKHLKGYSVVEDVRVVTL